MDVNFPVNYQIHDLPALGFTLENIYYALANNITGSIDDTVLPAVSDPSQDQSHFAPWFTGDSWMVWDDTLKGYIPATTVVGNVTLTASPTADRQQSLQDKSGVIALTDDAYLTRETVILREGLVSVDWSKASYFRCALGANRQTAIYMTNSQPGMEIELLVVNNGTSQTVAWDPVIQWPSAVAAQPPASTPGQANAVLVNLKNIAGTIYADYLNYVLNPISDLGTPTGLISS